MRALIAAIVLLVAAPLAGSAPGPEFARLKIVNRAPFPVKYQVTVCPQASGACPDVAIGEVPARSRTLIANEFGETDLLPRDAAGWGVLAHHDDLPCSSSRDLYFVDGVVGETRRYPRQWRVRFRALDFIECLAGDE